MLTETTEDLDATFMTATGDVPDTLGATSPGTVIDAAAPPSEPTFAITEDMLANLISMPFNMIAEGIGTGGEFWSLKPLESVNLAKAWMPVVQKLLSLWGQTESGALYLCAAITMMSVVPRLAREKSRRESLKKSTETVRYGDSFSSPVQLAPASPTKPTDSLDALDGL